MKEVYPSAISAALKEKPGSPVERISSERRA
jgi:hypothetical protein